MSKWRFILVPALVARTSFMVIFMSISLIIIAPLGNHNRIECPARKNEDKIRFIGRIPV